MIVLVLNRCLLVRLLRDLLIVVYEAKKLPKLSPRPLSTKLVQEREAGSPQPVNPDAPVRQGTGLLSLPSPRPRSVLLDRMGSGFLNVAKTIDLEHEDCGSVNASTANCQIVLVIG